MQATVRWSARTGIRIEARWGGHSYAGYSNPGARVLLGVTGIRGDVGEAASACCPRRPATSSCGSRSSGMRNVLARVPKGSAEMVAAAIRTIFAQADAQAVHEQLAGTAGKLGRQFPAVEQMLTEAAPDILAFAALPQSHWRRVWSTNPLERVNGEIKRRADVVGIFPSEDAILRLVGAVLMETHDEWQITERSYFSEGSMAAIYSAAGPPAIPDDRPALLAS